MILLNWKKCSGKEVRYWCIFFHVLMIILKFYDLSASLPFWLYLHILTPQICEQNYIHDEYSITVEFLVISDSCNNLPKDWVKLFQRASLQQVCRGSFGLQGLATQEGSRGLLHYKQPWLSKLYLYSYLLSLYIFFSIIVHAYFVFVQCSCEL